MLYTPRYRVGAVPSAKYFLGWMCLLYTWYVIRTTRRESTKEESAELFSR